MVHIGLDRFEGERGSTTTTTTKLQPIDIASGPSNASILITDRVTSVSTMSRRIRLIRRDKLTQAIIPCFVRSSGTGNIGGLFHFAATLYSIYRCSIGAIQELTMFHRGITNNGDVSRFIASPSING